MRERAEAEARNSFRIDSFFRQGLSKIIILSFFRGPPTI